MFGFRISTDSKIATYLAVLGFLVVVPFHHGYFQSSDEVAIYEVSRSLARGSISTPEIMYSYPGRGGEYFSQYQLGQSILAVPFYGLGRLARRTLPGPWQAAIAGPRRFSGQTVYGGSVEIFFVGLYPCFMTGVLLAVFYRFERSLGTSRRNAAIASLLLGFTTYVAAMSGHFLRHTTEAVAILGALFSFHRFRVGGRPRDLALGAVMSVLTPLVRLPAAAAGLGLGVAALWGVAEQTDGGRDRRKLLGLLCCLAVPASVGIGLHALGEWWKWEVPYLIVHETPGFDHSLAAGLAAYLLSPGLSIFVYSPLLLLVPWIFRSFAARFRAETVAIGVTVATFLVLFGKFDMWWAGYPTVGPRYLFIAVPFLLLPLGPWLDRAGTRGWVATGVLAAIGLAVQFVLLVVDYNGVMMKLRYWEIQPHGSFVFLLDERTPLLAMGGALRKGLFIDPWIWHAFHGGDHTLAAPDLVVLLLAVWSLCVAAAVAALRRALKSDDAPRGAPFSS